MIVIYIIFKFIWFDYLLFKFDYDKYMVIKTSSKRTRRQLLAAISATTRKQNVGLNISNNVRSPQGATAPSAPKKPPNSSAPENENIADKLVMYLWFINY